MEYAERNSEKFLINMSGERNYTSLAEEWNRIKKTLPKTGNDSLQEICVLPMRLTWFNNIGLNERETKI